MNTHRRDCTPICQPRCETLAAAKVPADYEPLHRADVDTATGVRDLIGAIVESAR